MSVSDREAYDAIVACLTTSRLFQTVMLDDVNRKAGGFGPTPLAVVAPGSWTEAMTDDDSLVLRRVTYRILLVIRGDDSRSRLHDLDRLSQHVSRLLRGAQFGTGCIPLLSTIDRGECRIASGSGEATCELRGSFSYLVSFSTSSPSISIQEPTA